MTRDQIIEALSRNYAKRFGGFGPTMEADIERANKTWPRYVREMEATLTALETTILGLADVIAGKAVIKSKQPPQSQEGQEAIWLAAQLQNANDCYRAMIAAKGD